MNIEFVHDLLAMFLDGFDADAQRVGDLLVRIASGDELEDFCLTRTEMRFAPFRLAAGVERVTFKLCQARRDALAKNRLALLGFSNGMDQFRGRALFVQ